MRLEMKWQQAAAQRAHVGCSHSISPTLAHCVGAAAARAHAAASRHAPSTARGSMSWRDSRAVRNAFFASGKGGPHQTET
jgi:hypothetical protein